jgi:hypothetical protein
VDLASIAPSLVIGVSSQADRAELGKAFALASRRLKTSTNSPFTIEQLTTALADLEEQLKTPRLRLWYRVPANSSVVRTNQVVAVRGVRYDIDNMPSDLELVQAQAADREGFAYLTLAAAIKTLYNWNWDTAGDLARTCLRLSKVEELRDEALNVLAAALLARGEASRALDALRKAVEGEWNLTLQTNLAVVASETDPATAIEQMSYLIAGAENSDQRLQAALLAVALWSRSQQEEKGSEDQDDFDPPPRSVLTAIYGLINSNDLTEENFYDLGMFLARVDSDAVVGASNPSSVGGLQSPDLDLPHIPEAWKEPAKNHWLSESPYRNSPSARLVEARARGLLQHIAEFGPIAKARDDRSRPWIMNAIDQYVKTLSRIMVSDDDPKRKKFALVQSYNLLDSGLPSNSLHRVMVLVVMILNLELALAEDGSPHDVLDEWLAAAFEQVKQSTFPMEGDERETMQGAISAAAATLLRYRHKEILPVLQKAERQSQLIAQQTGGFLRSLTVDRDAVRSASRPIVDFCWTAERTYERLLPMIDDAKAREGIKEILGVMRQLKQRLIQWI